MAAMIPALFSPRSLLTSLRDYRIGEFALPEEGSVLQTESGPRRSSFMRCPRPLDTVKGNQFVGQLAIFGQRLDPVNDEFGSILRRRATRSIVVYVLATISALGVGPSG
jgi:hypothetical protein